MFFKRREKRGRDVWIIAGLGNIGPEYDGTRHNCGFMAVDLLAAQYGIAVTKKKAKGTLGEGKIAGHDVVLVKPDTYMNLSGVCIRGVLDWYKQDESRLIVLYDDIDISPECGSASVKTLLKWTWRNMCWDILQEKRNL